MTKLTHGDPPRSDEKLAQEAHHHLSKSPPLQLVAELLTRLREMSLPWWTPAQLREAHPALDRMSWYAERPDLRQKITTDLTGLAPKAARNKTPEFQADLIDSVIDDGDITPATFDTAFEPVDLAVYGPAAEFWKLFRRRMPWDDDSTAHQDLIGWLLGALLSDKSSLDGAPRAPVLSALSVRTAIDGRVWHSRIPLDVRVAIDNARFAQLRDKPEPFTAAQDLAIATPALIAASIPLKELSGVFDVAGVALGFESMPVGPPPSLRPSVAPPPASVPPRGFDPFARSSGKEPGSGRGRDGERSEEKTDPPPPPEDPEPARSSRDDDVNLDDSAAWRVASPEDLAAAAALPADDAGVVSERGARGSVRPPSASGDLGDRPAPSPPSSDGDASEEGADEDELEHTNPWVVPTSLGEVGAALDAPRTTRRRRRD